MAIHTNQAVRGARAAQIVAIAALVFAAGLALRPPKAAPVASQEGKKTTAKNKETGENIAKAKRHPNWTPPSWTGIKEDLATVYTPKERPKPVVKEPEPETEEPVETFGLAGWIYMGAVEGKEGAHIGLVMIDEEQWFLRIGDEYESPWVVEIIEPGHMVLFDGGLHRRRLERVLHLPKRGR